MDIENRTIWQVAAGNGKDTNYAKTCLYQDVIILGPGKYGPWPECEADVRAESDGDGSKAGIIRRFAEEITPGDLVVLRIGTQEAYGVGIVEGPYQWNALFADVQGWNLQHVRRVRWLWHGYGTPYHFPAHTMKFGSTVQYLTSPLVREWITGLNIPERAYTRTLATL